MAAAVQQIFLAAALLVALACVAAEQWKNARVPADARLYVAAPASPASAARILVYRVQ